LTFRFTRNPTKDWDLEGFLRRVGGWPYMGWIWGRRPWERMYFLGSVGVGSW